MSRDNSGGRLEGFFTGKGFYIVLFLCAAVIGVSAWMLAAGNKTMVNEANEANVLPEGKRIETVIIPPPREEARPVINAGEEPAEPEAGPAEESGAEESLEVFVEQHSEAYVWPLQGELERSYDKDNLSYDVTMQDWRTHEGIDILAPLGSPVCAAHAGEVVSIVNDDLYGTTLTVDHGDGSCSVYSNLDPVTAVTLGEHVEPGRVIGSVGSSALCESGQCSHLHFVITVNGETRDPLDYLPA